MSLAPALQRIRESMAAACARRGRSPDAVRLLAATKMVPAERIREAFDLGVRLFGENRVQERETKAAALADLLPQGAEWHLLGTLQGNKAARALSLFSVIESCDSLALAQRLDRLSGLAGHTSSVLLEINVAAEPQKHGADPASALELAAAIQKLAHVELHGVMAVPPQSDNPEDARPHFAALAELGERIRLQLGHPAAGWELSMGMSHDYAVAIEEGATLIRIGSALFGARPPLAPHP